MLPGERAPSSGGPSITLWRSEQHLLAQTHTRGFALKHPAAHLSPERVRHRRDDRRHQTTKKKKKNILSVDRQSMCVCVRARICVCVCVYLWPLGCHCVSDLGSRAISRGVTAV